MLGISKANLDFHPDQQIYHGKVRDVYAIGNLLVMVASDRISAFDHILPAPIPYKGQVLNQLAAFFLKQTGDICPNWMLACPDPNVMIGHRCKPYRVEMVIRGYLAGHAWREYKSGKRTICGVSMPDGLREGDPFPEPIITPATKAEEGHDEDISKEDIIKAKIIPFEEYQVLETYTRALFQRGQLMANSQGLILVDTKYEFGSSNGEIMLIDEIHTPDSSRYYYLDGYAERQESGEKQLQLSKEFVREWLMENGFQGLKGQTMPTMPDEFIKKVSERYIELYTKMTGSEFIRQDYSNWQQRIVQNTTNALKQLR